MTTNIERAAEVMREAHDKPHWSPMHRCDNMAQALADAGLLMPDLATAAPSPVDALIAEKQAHQETLHLVRELWSDVHHHGNVGRASILRHLTRILEGDDG